MSVEISIVGACEAHVHFREGARMAAVADLTAQQFERAIIMPNLSEPIRTVHDAFSYRDAIMAVIPPKRKFMPMMTLYMTGRTTQGDIKNAAAAGIAGVKYYPKGATTNSESGVLDLLSVYPVIEEMERQGLPLLVHGECNFDEHGPADPYDKEKIFINEELIPLIERFPGLKISFEHITSAEAVGFMRFHGSERVACTITAHHLIYDRRDLHHGGLNPNLVCMPLLKRSDDKMALRQLATAGHPFVMLGTDSAPHPKGAKERSYGCASGCFTAPFALELYTQVFEEEGALSNLQMFAADAFCNFYRVAPGTRRITLSNEKVRRFEGVVEVQGDEPILPLYPPSCKDHIMLNWSIVEVD